MGLTWTYLCVVTHEFYSSPGSMLAVLRPLSHWLKAAGKLEPVLRLPVRPTVSRQFVAMAERVDRAQAENATTALLLGCGQPSGNHSTGFIRAARGWFCSWGEKKQG